MDFTPKQIEALTVLQDETTRQIYYGGAAGGGKTWLGCYWIIKMCMKYPGSRYAIGRVQLSTLKKTTLESFYNVAEILTLERDKDFVYREVMGEIRFENGSHILLLELGDLPSDPNFNRLRGLELTGAWIDEANEISERAMSSLNLRIRYKHTELGLIPKILLTSNPSKNWVYKEFYKPWVEKTLPEHKCFIQALPTDNPLLTLEYLQNIQDAPEPDRSIYLGKWETASDDNLITYDSLINMFTNTHVVEESEQMYITCDVARQGMDKAVIMIWRGLELFELHEYDKTFINELQSNIEVLKSLHKVPNSNIIIDADGVGAGLVDYIRGTVQFQNGSKALNGENFYNLKTQCYYKLAQYINSNKIYVSAELTLTQQDDLIQELEQVRRMDNENDGRMRIIPKKEVKDNIGRSPDYSDAMMMRMWVEVGATKKVHGSMKFR